MLDYYIYLNTLYVDDSQGYLHFSNDNLIIEIEEQDNVLILLHAIKAIVCFGEFIISPALMSHCTNQGITINFLSYGGFFRARIEGPIQGNIALRRSQFRKFEDADFTLNLAKNTVKAKIQNSLRLINKYLYKTQDDFDKEQLNLATLQIKKYIQMVEFAENHDKLRGIEG